MKVKMRFRYIFVILTIICSFVNFSHASNVNQATYKKISVGGWYWPRCVYKSVNASNVNGQMECLGQCLADSANCYLCIYNGSCWLGKAYPFFTIISVPQKNINSFINLDFLRAQLSNRIVPVQSSMTNTSWFASCNYPTLISNTDAFWDCLHLCLYENSGWCDYFIFDFSSNNCYMCNHNSFNGFPTTLTSVTVNNRYSSVQSCTWTVTGSQPAFWSTKLYLQLKSPTSFQECGSLCMIPSYPTCHYFMYVGGTCYHGNIFVQQSIMPLRTDTQTMYIMGGTTFFEMKTLGNSYTDFIIRSTTGISSLLCAQNCLYSGDCHFFIYTSGFGCLIGNFKLKPMANSYTGIVAAFIFKDFVRIDNVPDINYFNTTTPVSDWLPKIVGYSSNILSEGHCSSFCTLTYPSCELYVYVQEARNCLFGRLAANGTYIFSGSNIMRTRKLYQVFSVKSSGWFGSSCPTGFNLLSCGISGSSGPENYRTYYPVNAKSCECYDGFGINCEALCTTLPVSNFTIVSSTGNTQLFTVTCPAGTQLLGCHVYTYPVNNYEPWRKSFPSSHQTCACYDLFGFTCYASCASNIINHEIVLVSASGTATASCNVPNNTILGCGYDPASSPGRYQQTYITSNTSCTCFGSSAVNCYAICGSLN